MEHVHVSAIDGLVVIGVYILFKLGLTLARMHLDGDNAILQAVNALDL